MQKGLESSWFSTTTIHHQILIFVILSTQPKSKNMEADQSSTIISLNALPHLELVRVEGHAGFEMGSKEKEREQPIHTVKVEEFYMCIYPVTQALWEAIMKNNPSHFKGKNRPVEQVSWDKICGADGFLEKMNADDAVKGWLKEHNLSSFRLPSEAEWEYAARGGIYPESYEYAGSDEVDEVAWCYGNSHAETKAVGLKAPNALGIFDMSGNVWEWCADDWHGNYNGAPATSIPWIDEPRAAARVLRGGSWNSYPVDCRVASRNVNEPDWDDLYFGLRLVASLSSGG
jgi:formylglycine-generating enzyme